LRTTKVRIMVKRYDFQKIYVIKTRSYVHFINFVRRIILKK
jgi:hypothetical protein